MFEHHSNLDSYFEHNRKSLPVTIKTYGGWIKSKIFKFYIAKDDGLIVGFIIWKIEKEEPIYVRKKKGLVIALFVDQNHRRKGIAQDLFQKLSSWFTKNKISDVEIYVHSKNPHAIKTWGKLGFLTDSHRMRKSI